nr:ammonium transporter [Ipomoea trifida]
MGRTSKEALRLAAFLLYESIVKKKWAVNSTFMALYAFAVVLIYWVLLSYDMAWAEFEERYGEVSAQQRAANASRGKTSVDGVVGLKKRWWKWQTGKGRGRNWVNIIKAM